jgi:hypothetical protein
MSPQPLFKRASIIPYIEGLKKQVARNIAKIEKDYLLRASEADLCESLVSELRFDVPLLMRDQAYLLPPTDAQVDDRRSAWRLALDEPGPFYITGTTITVVVPFHGAEEAFYFQPSTSTGRVLTAEISNQELYLAYTRTDHDVESLQQEIDRDLTYVETHLQWMRQDVDPYNQQLPQLVTKELHNRKAKLLADDGLVASLPFPLERRAQDNLTFMPPDIRRKPPIPRPQVPPGEFHPEPALGEEEYTYILGVIQNMARVMELSPIAFATLDEHALRFQILVQLNGHYEGLATGETFSFQGKTDILIRYRGSNLFIAECMIWHGPRSLLNKLDQLLGYATWRDTKSAVVLLSRLKDFSTVLRKIRDTIPQHACYKRDLGQPTDTQFRYVFHQPRDPNREIIVTILAFDVPSEPAGLAAAPG